MDDYGWIGDFMRLVEERFGRRWANLLLAVLYLMPVGLFVHYGLEWIAKPLFHFLDGLLSGVHVFTVENALPFVVTTIFLSVSAFVILFGWSLYRKLNRRIIPQPVLDQLAELRSKGIGLMNKGKDLVESVECDSWKSEHKGWRDQVIALLQKNFTKTEMLMFTRLGFFSGFEPASRAPVDHKNEWRSLVREIEILEHYLWTQQARH